MQFLESSVLGLRSAFYELSSPDKKLKFLIFPMVHIGDPQYYANIDQRLDACDNVVYEGVKSTKSWFLVQSYKLVVKRKSLGLVTQRSALSLQNRGLNLIHGDTTAEAFYASWRKIPWYFRQLILLLSPLYGCWRYLTATRQSLAKGHTVDSLPESKEYIDEQANEAFQQALIKDRDEVLLEVLTNHIESNASNPQTTAIIYGARHMPAVISLLRRYGYTVTKSEWVQAI
ncbi:MAG: TraB/GumN family protein [Psychrosphaera sp.]|nr:TraB/GumN family protein [Psychrosphaera sp.]